MLDTCGENIKTKFLNKSARLMRNGKLQGRNDRELGMFVAITNERVLFR